MGQRTKPSCRAVVVAALLAVGPATLTGCGSDRNPDDSAGGDGPSAAVSDEGAEHLVRGHHAAVTSGDFTDWPFSAGMGVLRCRAGSAVTFETAGKEYGLNGKAKEAGYPPVDPLWVADRHLGHGLKVNISEVLDYGRALC
jgi:hypothetical protein